MKLVAALLFSVSGCASQGSEAALADTSGRRDSIAAVAAASMREEHVYGMMDHIHASDSAVGVLTDEVPSGQLAQPSGLTIKNNLIYVIDQKTGILYAIDKIGHKVKRLYTGLAGHVGSITIGTEGNL